MDEDQKKSYIAWLNDAHAMEKGLATVLEGLIKETEAQPEVQAKLREHLEETRRHAELVEGCIARHGESPSGGKDILSKVGAALNSFGMSMMSDAMVKNMHSSYAAEHFEIATYTVISAAARELADSETVAVCDEILADERDMATWLLEHIPGTVEKYLSEQKDE